MPHVSEERPKSEPAAEVATGDAYHNSSVVSKAGWGITELESRVTEQEASDKKTGKTGDDCRIAEGWRERRETRAIMKAAIGIWTGKVKEISWPMKILSATSMRRAMVTLTKI
jgi:hypothetical protein